MDVEDPGSRILEAFADAVLDLGLDGRIRYANTSAGALLGAAQLVGRDIADFLDEDGKVHSAEHLARAAAGTILDEEVDTLLVRGDGSPRWVRLRQTGLREDGRVTSVVLRLTDNHHDRALLEELRASQAGLVRAERIARSGSFTWHPGTGGTSSSAGLVELYGDHLAALLGGERGRLLEMTHPEDHARLEGHLDALLTGADDEIDVELRQLGRHGWMWVRLRAEGTRDAAGQLVEVTGTYQDVTRSRDAEDRLQDLVTQNSLMQAVATAANEAGTLDEVLMLARDLVVLHDDWDRARAFVPGPDGTGLVPHLSQEDPTPDAGTAEVAARELGTALRCLEEGRAVWDEVDRLTIAFPVVVADEVLAVLTITSLPPLYRHELIEQMTGQAALLIARVAERERARALLADARDRAVTASQHKSDFLATMSHEIRTPLNGIIGLNELLGATPLSDHQQHLVSGVAVSSRSLLDLINDILDFSKIEAGHLDVERVDFEMREVLAEVGGVLGESARSRGIDLEVSCGPDVPEVLSGDPTRMKQVLLNLGSNAVKFTAEGSVSIRATAGPAGPDDDGTLLRVEVRDTGVGITPDQRRVIFSPFSQADTSTTRTFGGTGLGLAICSEIVAAFGGEIGVESVPGAGSTFWFTARLDPATGSTEDATSVRARAVLGGTRVLVVDDTPRNRMILVEQLGWWGVLATEADGAAAAMASLEEAAADGRPYDLVLLDLNMPGHDGLDVAAAVRAGGYPADLPLLLLTSSLTPPPEELARAGITTSLTKPVPSSTLRDALLAALAPTDDAGRAAPAAPTPTGQGRVLVVEDNLINQMVARGFLEAQGYTVDTAEDGEQALSVVATGRYDAVLMDVQMPRLDGYATTRVLRQEQATTGDGRRLPIIAMTAAAVTGEREKCLASGMDDYITKPVSAVALASALARWVRPEVREEPEGPARPEDPEDLEDAGPPTREPAPDPLAAEDDAAPVDPHLDRDRLADLLELGPPHDFLDRAIENFLRRRAEVVAVLAEAVAEQDHPRLSSTAHALRGGAANIGLPVVVDLARRLEERGDTGQAAGCEPLLADLGVALGEAGTAISTYRDWFRSRAAS